MKHVITGRQMSVSLLAALAILPVLHGCNDNDDVFKARPEKLLVAWTNDSGQGALGAMSLSEPWKFDSSPLPIGPNATLRCAQGDLYALSQSDGTVEIVDLDSLQVRIIASLGASEPVDIAIVNPETAYVTRRSATHLLRLDIATGATTDVVDLGVFADDDGIPDLGMMAVHKGRLFVQIRRIASGAAPTPSTSPYIAVIDLETEKLVDTEPQIPEIQAIILLGTAPKHKMQIVRETDELFVSASGVQHDNGGIEVIDLISFRSKGLVVQEAIDAIGADLGAFMMITPTEGFIVSSTDLDVSSHLQRFTIEGGVNPPPDLVQSIGYTVPSLAVDSHRNQLFFPSGQHGKRGILVLDVASGELLTPTAIQTSGVPTDILPDCSRSVVDF